MATCTWFRKLGWVHGEPLLCVWLITCKFLLATDVSTSKCFIVKQSHQNLLVFNLWLISFKFLLATDVHVIATPHRPCIHSCYVLSFMHTYICSAICWRNLYQTTCLSQIPGTCKYANEVWNQSVWLPRGNPLIQLACLLTYTYSDDVIFVLLILKIFLKCTSVFDRLG